MRTLIVIFSLVVALIVFISIIVNMEEGNNVMNIIGIIIMLITMIFCIAHLLLYKDKQ